MEWKILLYARRKEPLDIPDDLSKYPMNDFELDYWRIVNSAPFRRLQDKTQVFPLDKSDFVRTRLTHSMETSALAKQLATMITANIRKNKSGTPYAMTEDEARDAANAVMCAGLLHDIGKLKIPTELLNKPGKYTDEEFAQVRLHTQYGYELLKPLPLDAHIKLAALSHHERCDGTGYPNGLTTNDIDPYARVVAIADVYDAMTTARSYRAPLCAFQVIANFERDGLQKYDTKCVLAFLNRIAGTYQNHRILLSDGRSANIVMLNDKQLSRPIVQLDDGSCIDLSTAGDLHIQAVL